MLKNFLKVAIRNLWKHKGYSVLNIFGLAMGMAVRLPSQLVCLPG